MDHRDEAVGEFGHRTRRVLAYAGGVTLLFTCLAVVPPLAGCHDGIVAPWIRRHTYPPPFRYVPRAELRSAMWTLGRQASELDRLLREDAPRTEVARLLAEMDDVAAGLGAGEWPSNHPGLGNGLEAFRRDVRAARLALERDPPNTYLAGSVTGACLYCHRP